MFKLFGERNGKFGMKGQLYVQFINNFISFAKRHIVHEINSSKLKPGWSLIYIFNQQISAEQLMQLIGN